MVKKEGSRWRLAGTLRAKSLEELMKKEEPLSELGRKKLGDYFFGKKG